AIFGNEDKNTVTGQVTDDHGFPLEHVFVFPEPIGKTGGPIPEIAVYTNRNGCFVWHVPPGRYQFRFQKASYQTTYSVVKADANKVVRIRIKMKKEKKTAQPS
ncbi:MAG: carboxypeptidase-like regulatory domain-containing protein, partial [Thermoactinomyces sp.]